MEHREAAWLQWLIIAYDPSLNYNVATIEPLLPASQPLYDLPHQMVVITKTTSDYF
jgi:hypothetical protein